MNRQLLNLFVMCLPATPLLADTSSSFQTASSSYVGFHESLKSVRDINGGTIIKALYSEDIPYEMRSAFNYACKLWEEAMPNSLPISIQNGNYIGTYDYLPGCESDLGQGTYVINYLAGNEVVQTKKIIIK